MTPEQARLAAAYLAARDPLEQSGLSGGTGGNASGVRWPRPCRGAARSWTSGARTGRSWRMSSRGAGNAASTSTRGVSTSRRTSPDLVALARHRYPHWSGHVLVGDAAGWSPPRRWDVVRTELVYVDSGVRPALVRRLLREFVSPGGSLLVCRYGDRTETARPLDVELREELASWGCSPAVVRTGTDVDGRVRTAVAVVHRP